MSTEKPSKKEQYRRYLTDLSPYTSSNHENESDSCKETEGDTDSLSVSPQKEKGGFEHKAEPTRYGDWEVSGRCSDF